MVGILGKKRPVYDDPPVPPMGAATSQLVARSAHSATSRDLSLVTIRRRRRLVVAFSRWLLSPRSFLSSEALLLHSDLASRSEPVSQNSGLAEQHRSDQQLVAEVATGLRACTTNHLESSQLSVRGTEGESQ